MPNLEPAQKLVGNAQPITSSLCSMSGVYESPRSGVGEHPDAKNMEPEILAPGHLRIRSKKKGSGAELYICARTNGTWYVRHNLSWPGIGHEIGERFFTSSQIRHAFRICEENQAMSVVNGLYRREYDHLTIPPYVGEMHDGVPCISIYLSSDMKRCVRELLGDLTD